MAATFTPVSVDNTQNQFIVDGTIALTGNYGGGATNGDVLSFAGFDIIKSQQIPTRVEIYEAPAAGTAPVGDTYIYAPGTSQALGLLVIFAGTTQYTQGSAYSAGLLAAVLKCRAWFPSLL